MTYESMPASAIVMATHKFQTHTAVAQDRFKMACAGKASRLYAPPRYKNDARVRNIIIKQGKHNIKTTSRCVAKHNVNTFTKVATSAVQTSKTEDVNIRRPGCVG